MINQRPVYPNELYHYGIKGQKWGIRRGPPYPLGKNRRKISGIDRKYNLDKWGKSPGTNILYITGYSGSGKSTLARKLAKKNNAEYLEMDYYLSNPIINTRSNKNFDKYLEEHNPEYSSILRNWDYWQKTMFGKNATPTKSQRTYFYGARDKCISEDVPGFARSMFGKRKVIAEGVQFYYKDDYPTERAKYTAINGKPLIIKGTSDLVSGVRQTLRDMKDPLVTDGTLKDRIAFAKQSARVRVKHHKENLQEMRKYKKNVKALHKKKKRISDFSNKMLG